MSKHVESSKVKINETLDIRGEVCPFTFIETKLKLEEMKGGEVLEVILDHEPAIRDVPKSVESEGHMVLAVERIDEKLWRILIKKR